MHIWNWVRKIFLSFHFSNVDDLLSFIKNDGSPLVNLIKLVVKTFSFWMIWRMGNYVRFQVKIDVSRAISVIKDLTCLVGNLSKSSMQNDILISICLSFFVLIFIGKVLSPLSLLDGSFLFQVGLK